MDITEVENLVRDWHRYEIIDSAHEWADCCITDWEGEPDNEVVAHFCSKDMAREYCAWLNEREENAAASRK